MNTSRLSAGKSLLRFVIFVAFLLLATWAAHLIKEALDLQIKPSSEPAAHRAIMLMAAVYAGLLALPFVPGAEIGIAMLAAFGAGIAPLIYMATVASMMLAYTAGRFLPISALGQFLFFLRLRRAAALVARAAPMSQDERLAMLLSGQSKRALKFGMRYRYLALALAVNTPGNFIIGGGGGIMMMAGLSGNFTPLKTLLTVAIAVSPVPLAVIFLGLQI